VHDNVDRIATDRWRLRVPLVESSGREVAVVTVHPAGDRRILRCLQSALDGGFDAHVLWLSDDSMEASPHPRLRETRIPAKSSFAGRLLGIPRLYRRASKLSPAIWHVHDFYLLPAAYLLARRSHRPVVYDVHEYYPVYYSSKLRIPASMRRLVERTIAAFETSVTVRIGGANAISETLAARFKAAGAPAVSTPNYPLTEHAPDPPPSDPTRFRRVVHTGSLTPEYGCDVLVAMAHRLVELDPSIQLLVVGRYPSEKARAHFQHTLRAGGTPANLTMVDPMPAHAVAQFLSTCGIGLSLLQDDGELPVSIPSKLFEYAKAGLAVVAGDLPASRQFIERHATGALVPPGDPEAFACAVAKLASEAEDAAPRAAEAARSATSSLSWERSCSPALQSLYEQLLARHPWPARRYSARQEYSAGSTLKCASAGID